MILNVKNSTAAYRCPYCMQAVKSVVGVFSLSGDMLKLKCRCGNSEMKMSYTSDGKIRIAAPCLACGNDHTFTVSKNAVLNRELLMLACPYTGIDICFTGERAKVEAELDRVEEEIMALISDGDEDGGYGYEEDPLDVSPDLSLLPMISTVTKELLADGKISCACKKRTENERAYDDVKNMLLLGGKYENECPGDIELIIGGTDFVIRCLECGREYRVNAFNYEKFCAADAIELK